MYREVFAVALLSLVVDIAEAKSTTMKGDIEFMKYLSKYGKHYLTKDEFDIRRQIYAISDRHIEKVNSNPKSSYRAGHNFFSDQTQSEKNSMFSAKYLENPEQIKGEGNQWGLPNVPNAWDWREQGKVSAVRNSSALCSDSYAQASVDTLEAAWAIKSGDEAQLVDMSVQQIIDCTSSTGNMFCFGGDPYKVYDYMLQNQVMAEKDYPYTGFSGYCKADGKTGVTSISGTKRTSTFVHTLQALYEQPITMAISGGNEIFMLYESGIISRESGCPTYTDHYVTAVGWGETDEYQYFIVKNSWGTDWGEQGYARIDTGSPYYSNRLLNDFDSGVCGIFTGSVTPTL